MTNLRGFAAGALRVFLGVGFVAAITLAGYRVAPVNATTIGFCYLVAILIIAGSLGLRESIAASIVASVCFNYYFLPPVLHFTIADPQNWVALFAFLFAAILVSQLSTRARQQTQRALDRQSEMERLYALSRAILLTESNEPVARQAAMQIAQIFGFSGVSLYERSNDNIYRAGGDDLLEWDSRLREVALQGVFLQDPQTNTAVTAIRLGADPIGSLALRGPALPDSALQSIANLVAIALERARSLELANRADVTRQSEQLKSVLLDAIAHEFKTPLTSIKAASTALLSSSMAHEPGQQEMLSIVDEETDRLGRLVTEAIQMARIDAGRIHLHRRPESVRELVARILDNLRPDRNVTVDIAADVPRVDADAELLELALRQLIDNAVKYSPAGSPVTVKARHEEGRIVVSVRNEGAGIPEASQSRIFERFFREAETAQNVPGTGMGLSIARDIVQAHDGQIWVESSPGRGAEFFVALPSERKEAYV
jgi:two-component system sensor histidine kinase KdpD